jgi:hypothetical protein
MLVAYIVPVDATEALLECGVPEVLLVHSAIAHVKNHGVEGQWPRIAGPDLGF